MGMKMKSKFYFLGLFFCLQLTSAQKLIKKSIVNGTISHIQIDAKNCFEIELGTNSGEELVIEAQIEGEYKEDLVLNIVEEGATIKINTDFQPNFINPNDKLSAHKVISIALRILVPEQKNVHVFGTNCNVIASGLYDFLKVSLSDGRCDLINVREAVEVRTQSGHISVKYSHAIVRAKSKYGRVTGNISKNGNGYYDLSTVTGDIVLKRVE